VADTGFLVTLLNGTWQAVKSAACRVPFYGMLSGLNSDSKQVNGSLGAMWMGMLDDGGENPLIGFPHNRMAYLTSNGGSVAATTTPTNGAFDSLFTGTVSGVAWSGATTGLAVTITLPEAWSYGRDLMIQWKDDFYPTSFLIEYSKDGTTWTTGFDITSWAMNFFCGKTDDNWYGTVKIRITARAYKNSSAYYEITEIGWTNYSYPTDSYSLSKTDGGTVYNNVNLPTGKEWRVNGESIIAQTITNGVTASAPSQDAVYDALAGKAPLNNAVFSGYTVLGCPYNAPADSAMTTNNLIGWYNSGNTGVAFRVKGSDGIIRQAYVTMS
jgi:hypothetical protein